MPLPTGVVIVLYILMCTGGPVLLHYRVHGVVNYTQAALAFFCGLNALIAFWEIALGCCIKFIETTYRAHQKNPRYKSDRLAPIVDFFVRPMRAQDVFSLEFWSAVWSTYALYDPSYANRESFGFFVDVGNGWTTLVPSVGFVAAMTYDVLPARTVGFVGLLMFWQELYGTLVYFLSYLLNRRYAGRSAAEVVLFVGGSNGLWFAFPALGMATCVALIDAGTFECVR